MTHNRCNASPLRPACAHEYGTAHARRCALLRSPAPPHLRDATRDSCATDLDIGMGPNVTCGSLHQSLMRPAGMPALSNTSVLPRRAPVSGAQAEGNIGRGRRPNRERRSHTDVASEGREESLARRIWTTRGRRPTGDRAPPTLMRPVVEQVNRCPHIQPSRGSTSPCRNMIRRKHTTMQHIPLVSGRRRHREPYYVTIAVLRSSPNSLARAETASAQESGRSPGPGQSNTDKEKHRQPMGLPPSPAQQQDQGCGNAYQDNHFRRRGWLSRASGKVAPELEPVPPEPEAQLCARGVQFTAHGLQPLLERGQQQEIVGRG